MWYRRDINRLVLAGKHDEAVVMVCQKFGISVAHAEDILRELDKYRWFVRHDAAMDKKVVEFGKDIVGASKWLKTVQTEWGLLNCKLYMEDISKGLKEWPRPLEDKGVE